MQTYPDFAALLAYINSVIVTNGAEEIDAIDMNNVVNGLLTFIEQSSLNWQTAQVISTGGVITGNRPIKVFITSTPTSLQWSDNIYNQYIFVNTTANPIPITGGLVYYDINLVAQTALPAYTTVSIVKATNGQWISIYNESGTGSTTRFHKLPFKIGTGGSPMNDGDTILVITVSNASLDSEFVNLDNSWMQPNRNDQFSYTVVYTSTNITFTFNQGVSNGQNFYIKYATS